jgi:hypothetical protein
MSTGNALCLAEYGDIKEGAIVPPVNELWDQVQEWLNAGNDWMPEPPVDPEKQYAPLLAELEGLRKAEEERGVIVGGVRYSGAQGNRQALKEALNAAAEYGLTVFTSWKDSDSKYHPNHPVADVHEALSAIGLRRMALIAKEGKYAELIKAGASIDLSGIQWEV